MVRRLVATFGLAIAAIALGLVLFGGSASAHVDPNDPSHGHAKTAESKLTCNAAGLCTHGPDIAPPGVNPAEDTAPSIHQAGVDDKAVCDGNGTSGNRIQVLYVYTSTDRFNTYVDSFPYWAVQADKVYQDSAKRTGGPTLP